MNRLLSPGRRMITSVMLLTLFASTPKAVYAESPVKLKKFKGMIDLTAEGAKPFVLSGTASHLGKFTCRGEVDFAPGEEEGSLVGAGVAVFKAANGDLLVGNVKWEMDAGGDFRTSRIHFSWTDSVEFSDGTIILNTGRFVDDRPPGLVVIAIIAILIGLLLPAVQ